MNSNKKQIKKLTVPKLKSKIGRAAYPITLGILGVIVTIKYLQINKKIFWNVMLFGTFLGWIWGWHLCNVGPFSAWLFPIDAYLGIEFGGMILEDWLFYPITGGFFTILILRDPFKFIKFNPNIKLFLFWVLCMSTAFGLLIFGKCGQSIALIFGVPAIVLFYLNWSNFNCGHFLRTAVIVVPMEFIWDHWAVGRHQQWIYIKESGMFGDFWFRGIPIGMSPYLGIIACYFIFTLTYQSKRLCFQK